VPTSLMAAKQFCFVWGAFMSQHAQAGFNLLTTVSLNFLLPQNILKQP
jgi:hypothetical protein